MSVKHRLIVLSVIEYSILRIIGLIIGMNDYIRRIFRRIYTLFIVKIRRNIF